MVQTIYVVFVEDKVQNTSHLKVVATQGSDFDKG